MTIGSLFTGIGGFDLAFERLGVTCLWQSEIDKACNNVLAKRFPGVRNVGNVSKIKRVKRPDLVCGGFPCQDLSVAGKRTGLAGERSGLWFAFRDCLARLRPRWLVIENVPGLLSSSNGWDMGIILRQLGELGYWWAYRVLDAQYFGLAQRRKRVFIVGHLGDRTAAAKVLFEPQSCDGDSPPRREKRAEVAHTIRSRSASRGVSRPGRGEEDDDNLIVNALDCRRGGPDDGEAQANHLVPEPFVFEPRIARNGRGQPSDKVHALRGHEFGGTSDARPVVVTHTLKAEGADGSEDGSGRGVPLVWDERNVTSKHNRAACRPGDPVPTMHAKPMSIASELCVRRLTPIECERLQGFPDGWTEPAGSDSARYRCIGNAVAVPVAEWIGRRIMEACDAER